MFKCMYDENSCVNYMMRLLDKNRVTLFLLMGYEKYWLNKVKSL